MTDVTSTTEGALFAVLHKLLPIDTDAVTELVQQFVSAGGTAVASNNVTVLTDAAGRRTSVRMGAPATTSATLVGALPEPELDPVPHAAVANALRIRTAHAKLLSSGAFDYNSLAEGRGATVESTRQFVSRAQRRNELFTVDYQGATWVPAILLDDELNIRPEFGPLIAVLKPSGSSGWAMWNWLVSANGWLDGATPIETLTSHPAVVLEAAHAHVTPMT